MASKKLLNEFFNSFAISLIDGDFTKSLTLEDLKKEIKKAVNDEDISQIKKWAGFFIFIKNEDFSLNNLDKLDEVSSNAFDIFKEEFINNNEFLENSEKVFLELLLTDEFFGGK